MSATNTLNKVKAVLGLEVSLEQMKLENGTVVEAESFESGASIFIVTEDEKVALPVGAYKLEDGTELIVEEEGVIASIGEVEDEAVEEEVVEEEVEAEEMEYVTKKEFYQFVEEVKAMVEKMEVEKMSEQSEEIEATEVVEVSDEAKELKAELSKPAVEPLTHSPKEDANFKAKFNFNKNKSQTTYDRILTKIANIQN
jgi:hypothetical protein